MLVCLGACARQAHVEGASFSLPDPPSASSWTDLKAKNVVSNSSVSSVGAASVNSVSSKLLLDDNATNDNTEPLLSAAFFEQEQVKTKRMTNLVLVEIYRRPNNRAPCTGRHRCRHRHRSGVPSSRQDATLLLHGGRRQHFPAAELCSHVRDARTGAVAVVVVTNAYCGRLFLRVESSAASSGSGPCGCCCWPWCCCRCFQCRFGCCYDSTYHRHCRRRRRRLHRQQ